MYKKIAEKNFRVQVIGSIYTHNQKNSTSKQCKNLICADIIGLNLYALDNGGFKLPT
jgi:hypothetical protein